MKKRLCFIVPNIKISKQIVQQLHAVGILDSQVHVLGKNPKPVEKAHLHKASVFQTTNLGAALKRSILMSVLFVLIIYAIFKWTMPLGLELSAFGMVSMVIFGLVIGIWIALMIGFGVPSREVEAAQEAIQSGRYLMMVDVLAEREKEITDMVLEQYPEVYLAPVAQST